MFLKTLKIQRDETLIREITFFKGINLIVDETKTDAKEESGNNVGKTTVLRLVDFCLGSDGKNIYNDPEFKGKSNSQIEMFLKNKNVLITLVLKADLENASSQEIEIRRNFLSYSNKIQEINGVAYSNEDFPKKLKELIFQSTEAKPTLRQIIAKNIRDEKNRLSNAVKVLHASTTAAEYEALYLFWFGIDPKTADRKQKIIARRKIEEHLQSGLRKESSLSQIDQALLVLDKTIDDLTIKKQLLNLNDNYEVELAKLNDTKSEISRLTTELSRLELRKNLILESSDDLQKQLSDIDAESVRKVYEEAKALVPQLQRSFAETLHFHNQMVMNKQKYITQELPNLSATIASIRREIASLLTQEKALTNQLRKSSALDGLEELILKLNDAHEKRGRFKELKRLWEASQSKISALDKELVDIDAGLQSQEDLLNSRVAKFNTYFSAISNRLYGEQFYLSVERNGKGYELVIGSISGNLGTGKKKGQIAAFDLAYIQFADELDIPCAHFILHDQIENIHDNQISNLLTEIISNINCQYIIPILRDKLPADIDVKRYEILSLSQQDKLFKEP